MNPVYGECPAYFHFGQTLADAERSDKPILGTHDLTACLEFCSGGVRLA